MKRTLLALVLLLAATVVWAASPDRYLHVRVTNPTTHELVRVNVPLSLAEKVIPAINHGELHDGKIRIGAQLANDGVDLIVGSDWNGGLDSDDGEAVDLGGDLTRGSIHV